LCVSCNGVVAPNYVEMQKVLFVCSVQSPEQFFAKVILATQQIWVKSAVFFLVNYNK